VSERPADQPEAIEWDLPWGPIVRGMRWGNGADRVVLLHEPGMDKDIDAWSDLPRQLAVHLPLEVIAVDLPGHGLSDDPWEAARLPGVIEVGFEDTAGKRFLLAAGISASVGVAHAAQLSLAGIIGLSPIAPAANLLPRSPRTPKHFFAGSLTGDDLRVTRHLAQSCGGWAVVTAVPLAVQGTELLAPPWLGPIQERIVAFIRDCLYASPIRRSPPSFPSPSAV
jgi:pimeloyl-ACP methyl ester carboxylesterase